MTQIVLTFVLMPLVEASLAILDCRSVMGRNVDFQAPDTVCFTGNHLSAAVFAILVLVLLLGIYPGAIAWKLHKIYKSGNIKYEGDDKTITIIDELNMTLYGDFRRSYFFIGPILIWERGALVLLFKLLNGKVYALGFSYICILAVPYLFGIEAYMNREICLCWLVLMALNLSTLEYDLNIEGIVTFILILPAALHLLRWGFSAYKSKNKNIDSNMEQSLNGSLMKKRGSMFEGKKGSEKGDSIENLSVRKGSRKGNGASSSAVQSAKESFAQGTVVNIVRSSSMLVVRKRENSVKEVFPAAPSQQLG
ncbi:hypothetical protein HK100_003874 [Physocladia obscura]|uniref:Uncharacterized protein n=1 Tax=Physocladia obscura TaxID=109957 RepID=A0AAD5TAN5_9FUNG|nr:hypothetical protein HK100_003874 [Physocladia obscura]